MEGPGRRKPVYPGRQLIVAPLIRPEARLGCPVLKYYVLENFRFLKLYLTPTEKMANLHKFLFLFHALDVLNSLFLNGLLDIVSCI